MFLLINYSIATIILNMMILNMAKKSFSPLQPAVLFIVTPILAYHVGGVSGETEKLLSQAMTVLAFLWFMAKMTVLSIQWCDYSGKSFWFLKAAPVEDDKAK